MSVKAKLDDSHTTILAVPNFLNRQRVFERPGQSVEMALGQLDFPRTIIIWEPVREPMPSHHVEKACSKKITVRFVYDVAPEEKTKKQDRISIGKKSGRILQFDAPLASLSTSFEKFLTSVRILGQNPKIPMRTFAHYEVMVNELLPKVVRPIIDQISAIRRGS